MTLTDPRSEPSLLQTVVANEHARLAALLTEASKRTATPGVNEELLGELRRQFAAHVNAEQIVIHPVARSALDDAEIARLDRDTASARAALAADQPDLDTIGDALQAHIPLTEELLVKLYELLGGRRMATLGFEYGPIAEASPKRITTDTAR